MDEAQRDLELRQEQEQAFDNEHQGAPEMLMFLASTVHDMKNSISVLSGTLERLLVGAGAPAAAATPPAAAPPADPSPADPAAPRDYEQLAQMLYQTRRLNDNLIQLLALYKEVGKPGYPFDPMPRAVSELVEQAAGQARILVQSRGIALELDFPPDAIWSLDEDLIIGVLVHAINNAIRYTRDRVRVAVRIDGEFLEMRVEDNGEGFPPALIEAGISVMAVRDAASRAPVNFLNNSSGLGLYFSSEVAKMHRHRQHGGSIALENGGTLGGGCFILRLP